MRSQPALYGGGHCGPEISVLIRSVGRCTARLLRAAPPPSLQNPSGMAPPQSWRTFLATMRASFRGTGCRGSYEVFGVRR